MRFESPGLLLLLLIIPIWWWVLVRRRQSQFIQYSGLATLKSFASTSWWSQPYFLPFLRTVALIFLILTLARPQTGRSFTEVLTVGVDIVLTIDTSKSMEALDLKLDGEHVTRLTVLKKVLGEFIENRTQDRIGMVVFGEEAFTQAPLTHDHRLLSSFLDQVFIGMAGDKTAIGSAIAVGAKRLKDLNAPSKVMILATDGENTAGRITPLQATEAANEFGVKIYTIGIGTEGEAPIAIERGRGFPGGVRRIQYVNLSLDEALLRQIAEKTGGLYFRATDTESLQQIYKTIDELEKTEAKVKEYHQYEEQYAIFLIPALLLFLFEFILAHTRLRRLP